MSLCNLPSEIQMLILERLDRRDVETVRQVSSDLNAIVRRLRLHCRTLTFVSKRRRTKRQEPRMTLYSCVDSLSPSDFACTRHLMVRSCELYVKRPSESYLQNAKLFSMVQQVHHSPLLNRPHRRARGYVQDDFENAALMSLMPRLESLAIDAQEVKAVATLFQHRELNAFRSLTTVHLARLGTISGEAVVPFLIALLRLPSLRVLHLEECEYAAFQELRDPERSFSSVTTLTMQDCSFTARGVSSVLECCAGLQEFALSGYFHLDGHAEIAIAEGINTQRATLSKLSLSGRITCSRHLMRSLHGLTSLRKLYLWGYSEMKPWWIPEGLEILLLGAAQDLWRYGGYRSNFLRIINGLCMDRVSVLIAVHDIDGDRACCQETFPDYAFDEVVVYPDTKHMAPPKTKIWGLCRVRRRDRAGTTPGFPELTPLRNPVSYQGHTVQGLSQARCVVC